MIGDSFCSLFDKVKNVKSFGYGDYSQSSWIVCETDPNSTFRTLEVITNGARLIGFNQNLTKSMPCITVKRSTKIEDKECDGLAFVNFGGQERLLLVEMKSKYSTQSVSLAIRQMCFSFLKIHSVLSLCGEYILDQVEIDFCVATKCARDVDEESKVNMFKQQANMANEQKDFGCFFSDLFTKGKTIVKFSELLKFINVDIPVSSSLKNKEITVHLQKTGQYNESSAVFYY